MAVIREHNGKKGYIIAAPFELEDGNSMIVSRGWVPEEMKSKDTRKEEDKKMTITGVLRSPEHPGRGLKSNNSIMNEWHTFDLDAMSFSSNLRNFYETSKFFLQQIEMNPSEDVEEKYPLVSKREDLYNWYTNPTRQLTTGAGWLTLSGVFTFALAVIIKRPI